VAASKVGGHFPQPKRGGLEMTVATARRDSVERGSAPQGVEGASRAKKLTPREVREQRARWVRSQLYERVPKHVRLCYGNGGRSWWIYTWAKDNPEKKQRVPYLCQSWRCPHCREHEGHVTFARIQQACAPLSADGFLLLVLTLDRPDSFDGPAWLTADAAYKALSRKSRAFLKRLRRFQARMGWRVLNNEWIATVEAHKSGWPHLNIVLWSPELAEYCREHKREHDMTSACGGCERTGCAHCRQGTLMWGELLDAAEGTGWGRVSTIECARDGNVERLTGYIVKLAGLADKSAGEVAKLTQLPTVAPERFRRLRSGKGFLPPRFKDERFTGTLVRRYQEVDGTVTVQPLADVSDERAKDVAECCQLEEDLAHEELAAWRQRNVKLYRAPVIVAFRGEVVPDSPEGELASLSVELSAAG